MEKFYILVENDRNIIVISEKKTICEYFKERYQALMGDVIKLDIHEVDSEYIKLGVTLNHNFYYTVRT